MRVGSGRRALKSLREAAGERLWLRKRYFEVPKAEGSEQDKRELILREDESEGRKLDVLKE